MSDAQAVLSFGLLESACNKAQLNIEINNGNFSLTDEAKNKTVYYSHRVELCNIFMDGYLAGLKHYEVTP